MTLIRRAKTTIAALIAELCTCPECGHADPGGMTDCTCTRRDCACTPICDRCGDDCWATGTCKWCDEMPCVCTAGHADVIDETVTPDR